MKKLYLAGAYSSDNILGVRDNIALGIRVSIEMRRLGFAPFCPWSDWEEAVAEPNIRPLSNYWKNVARKLGIKIHEPLTMEDWKEVGLAWLRCCDAMLIIDEGGAWMNSEGTKAEFKEALALNIPVFYYSRLGELLQWASERNEV